MATRPASEGGPSRSEDWVPTRKGGEAESLSVENAPVAVLLVCVAGGHLVVQVHEGCVWKCFTISVSSTEGGGGGCKVSQVHPARNPLYLSIISLHGPEVDQN